MVIKHHHIERLLKNFALGTQIVFEHKLEEWRQSIGVPLVYHQYMSSKSSIRSFSPTSPSIPSRPSTPIYCNCNQSDVQTSQDGEILLSTILNETPKATMLVEYYNKFLKFQDEQRISLINVVAQYYEDKGIALTLPTSYRLEKEIIERFPSEKLVIIFLVSIKSVLKCFLKMF